MLCFDVREHCFQFKGKLEFSNSIQYTFTVHLSVNLKPLFVVTAANASEGFTAVSYDFNRIYLAANRLWMVCFSVCIKVNTRILEHVD